MSGGEWAAWIQAVGSVIAIFVAIYIGWSSDKRARELVEKERARQAGIVAAGAAALVNRVQARAQLGGKVLEGFKQEVDKLSPGGRFIVSGFEQTLEKLSITVPFDHVFPSLIVLEREAGQMVMLVANCLPVFNDNMTLILRHLNHGATKESATEALEDGRRHFEQLDRLCAGSLALLEPAHLMESKQGAP